MCKALRAFQSCFNDLVTGIQTSVCTVADKCLSTELISEEAYRSVLGVTRLPGEAARVLLLAVKDSIKARTSAFDDFQAVINETLPKGTADSLDEKLKLALEDAHKHHQESSNQTVQQEGDPERCHVEPLQGTKEHGSESNSSGSGNAIFVGNSFQHTGSNVRQRVTGTETNSDSLVPAVQETPSGHTQDDIAMSRRDVAVSMVRKRLNRAAAFIVDFFRDLDGDIQHQEAESFNLKKNIEDLKGLLSGKKEMEQQLKAMIEDLNREKEDNIAHLQTNKTEVESLKRKVSETEGERHALVMKCERYKRERDHITSKYEQDITDYIRMLESFQVKLRGFEQVVQVQENVIERHMEQLEIADRKFVKAKRRAICAHWFCGATILLLILAMLVVALVYFLYYGPQIFGFC